MQQMDHKRNRNRMLFAKAFNFRKRLLKHTKREMEGKDLSYRIAVVASSKKNIWAKDKIKGCTNCFITQSHLLAKDQLTAIINTSALTLETRADLENQIIIEQLSVLIQVSKRLLLCSALPFLNWNINYFGKAHLTLLPTTWFPHWTKCPEKSF